jgi:hypothetical protein
LLHKKAQGREGPRAIHNPSGQMKWRLIYLAEFCLKFAQIARFTESVRKARTFLARTRCRSLQRLIPMSVEKLSVLLKGLSAYGTSQTFESRWRSSVVRNVSIADMEARRADVCLAPENAQSLQRLNVCAAEKAIAVTAVPPTAQDARVDRVATTSARARR